MSNRMYRLPIHHDDRVFRDQTERMFRDMQLRMDGGLHQPWPELDGTWTRTGSTSDSLTQPPTRADSSFFQLRPRQIPIQQVPGASASEKRGSREILDDATIGDLFLEDPQTKSRMFRMSFDVSKYDPKDVQVRVEDKCLMVEAKMVETSRGGAQTTSEFNRRIMLPNDVDVEKLTSTLSSDGVLTLQAPCPPRYQALGGATGDGTMLGTNIPAQRVSPVQFTSLPSQFAGNTQFQSTPPKQSPISIQHTSSPLVPQGASPTTQQGGPRAPVVISVMPATPGSVPIDTPIFTTIDGGRRRLDLVLDLGRQYAAQDVVVKVDGHKMFVEATREEKEHGRTCKTSVTREFDLSEDIDPGTVQAMMKPDGELAIVATTPYRR